MDCRLIFSESLQFISEDLFKNSLRGEVLEGTCRCKLCLSSLSSSYFQSLNCNQFSSFFPLCILPTNHKTYSTLNKVIKPSTHINICLYQYLRQPKSIYIPYSTFIIFKTKCLSFKCSSLLAASILSDG